MNTTKIDQQMTITLKDEGAIGYIKIFEAYCFLN
jgi:hypothetical protein